MGNPLYFSLELPQRCLQLIDDLWPAVEKTKQRDRPDLGSLTTTFLISMSIPIVCLPIERIERHKHSSSSSYADDRHLNRAATKEIIYTLGGHQLAKTPFYMQSAWSFAERSNIQNLNIANCLPDDLAAELDSAEAANKARRMSTSEWCSILRNAMAHGGIAFLDKEGKTSFGQPVCMYAFVSGKYDDADNLIGVKVLRISEASYREFLRLWVDWLKSKGLDNLAT